MLIVLVLFFVYVGVESVYYFVWDKYIDMLCYGVLLGWC